MREVAEVLICAMLLLIAAEIADLQSIWERGKR
jgi:hypothetical protein